MSLRALGIVLIFLGVGALFFGHFYYTETKPALDVGPLHVKTQQEHQVDIPTIAGVVVLLSGLALVFVRPSA